VGEEIQRKINSNLGGDQEIFKIIHIRTVGVQDKLRKSRNNLFGEQNKWN
jgi:hypothetical protein